MKQSITCSEKAAMDATKIKRINEFYLSSVCHVCKKHTSTQKRCSDCKLFTYCTIDHQKKHWKDHKKFCKMIKSLLNKNGKTRHHILDINGTATLTHGEWKQMRMDLKILWQHLLNRKLSALEDQVWMFPRVCEICHTSKQDILLDCEICYSASYCCIDHQKKHMNIHKKFCQSLNLCYLINVNIFYNKLNVKLVPTIRDECNILPVNTENFVKYCTQINSEICDYNDILIGDIVSPFLTIFHGLRTCNLIKNGNYIKTSFVVHVVGASLYEESLPWEFLIRLFFCWIKNLENIIVIIIGPELQLNGTRAREKQGNDTSTTLLYSDHKNYKIIYERCLYHDYVISESAISADLIAVFNCGLHEYQKETENDIWAKSIYTLTSVSNMPLIITSYTLEEALLDFKRLSDCNNTFEVIVKCRKNPFAGLRPLRDWATENSPIFFQNNYVTIVKK